MPRAKAAALALFCLGVLTCTWDLVLKVDIAGFTLKAHQGFFFFAFLLAALPKIPRLPTELRALPLKRVGLPFLGLAIYYGASSIRSEFPLKSALYSGWLVFSLCAIWLTTLLLRDSLSKKFAAITVLCAAAFQAAVITIDQIAYQYGYRDGLIGFNQDTILQWGVSRPHGFAMEPSYAAIFLTFALILGFGLFSTLAKKFRPLLAAGLLLGLFALVASTSRTGWISTLLGVLALLAIGAIRAKKIPWKGLGALAAAGIAIGAVYYATISPSQRAVLNESLVSSVYKGTDGSGNARLKAHLQAWQMAKETNGLGTGLGASYKYWTARYHAEEVDKPKSFDENSYGREVVMSLWGQLLAEGGIPALLFYFAGAFFLVQALWRAWGTGGDPLTQAALASALVFFLFTAFFLGNVARGDVWVWFAIWSRMALPDAGETGADQRA